MVTISTNFIVVPTLQGENDKKRAKDYLGPLESWIKELMFLSRSLSTKQEVLLNGRGEFFYGDVLSSTLVLETDYTVLQSEQGIILAKSDVDARMKGRSSLTNDNIAGLGYLTVAELEAKPLSTRVSSVRATPLSLFMGEKLKT
jgi:hypothetical protein